MSVACADCGIVHSDDEPCVDNEPEVTPAMIAELKSAREELYAARGICMKVLWGEGSRRVSPEMARRHRDAYQRYVSAAKRVHCLCRPNVPYTPPYEGFLG